MGGLGGAGGLGGLGGGGEGGTGGTGGVPDPWEGPVESLKSIEIGPVILGTPYYFPVPGRTLGFTVQAEPPSPGSAIGIYRLRPPAGASVVFAYSMVGHTADVFAGPDVISVADPQADSADAWPVQVGDWKLELGSDVASGSCTATVWARRTNDGAFHGGVMDINVIISPQVATQAYINQVLAALFPYAGLDIGTVTFFDGTAASTVIDDYAEYQALLESSQGLGTAPAVNLFVVDDFLDANFGGAIGVAGGIPGSPMLHGTRQSGVAYEPTGDPNYDATILMHEVGHLGGLFHTTEFQIVETDSLSDTPECDNAVIQANAGACPDKTNVMFPIAYGATTFSLGQVTVLQGSALYRGILDAGGVPVPPSPLPSGPAAAFPRSAPDAGSPAVAPMPTMPDALEQILGQLSCGADYAERALAIARRPDVVVSRAQNGSAYARLAAIVLDSKLPILLRKRALGLLPRAADAREGAQAQELVLTLAASASAPPRLRAEAVRVMKGLSSAGERSTQARMASILAAARTSASSVVRVAAE